MQFIVDEQSCRRLRQDMLTHMRQLAMLVQEIDNNSSLLRGALGDDYEAIAKTMRIVNAELQNAGQEMNTIIDDMGEYMARVHQARVSLN